RPTRPLSTPEIFAPAAVNILKFIPAAGGTGRGVFARNIAQELGQGVAKIDHQLTAKDRLSGRYFIDHFRNAAIFHDGSLLPTEAGVTSRACARRTWRCPGCGRSARRSSTNSTWATTECTRGAARLRAW